MVHVLSRCSKYYAGLHVRITNVMLTRHARILRVPRDIQATLTWWYLPTYLPTLAVILCSLMVADVSLDVRARTSGAVETDDDNDDDKE